MLDDVGAAEERDAPAAAADEGVFEPFNLDRERETGHFDADGNYVEAAPEKDEEDAWLEGVEVDERMADKCRREAEAEASKPEARSGSGPRWRQWRNKKAVLTLCARVWPCRVRRS
jgi:hypothetical protein